MVGDALHHDDDVGRKNDQGPAHHLEPREAHQVALADEDSHRQLHDPNAEDNAEDQQKADDNQPGRGPGHPVFVREKQSQENDKRDSQPLKNLDTAG